MAIRPHWPKKQINVEVSQELRNRIVDYCHWEDRRLSDVVGAALLDYLQKAEREHGEPFPPSPKRKDET